MPDNITDPSAVAGAKNHGVYSSRMPNYRWMPIPAGGTFILGSALFSAAFAEVARRWPDLLSRQWFIGFLCISAGLGLVAAVTVVRASVDCLWRRWRFYCLHPLVSNSRRTGLIAKALPRLRQPRTSYTN